MSQRDLQAIARSLLLDISAAIAGNGIKPSGLAYAGLTSNDRVLEAATDRPHAFAEGEALRTVAWLDKGKIRLAILPQGFGEDAWSCDHEDQLLILAGIHWCARKFHALTDAI